ncbi:cytochrome b/b6 family protein [delta proteobacterium NaphS2]|nr:cytochrome b/b6 family protein [delta proteobacterium NaphS2]
MSWGLGGTAATLIGLLISTGVLLLLVYEPSADRAYSSILTLTQETPFGLWIRNIHHWSANFLIGIILLHIIRVVLTGAFGSGRRLNWVIGLFLLLLALGANFTGYLLPWDQLAYWAVTICTSMLGYVPLFGSWLQDLFRGGAEVGAPTLANFFVLHVAVIPGFLIILLLWHFWLVRRAGGLVQPEDPVQDAASNRVPTIPNLIAREAAVGMVMIAFVMILSIFVNAPLLEQANPGMSPFSAKAPWYFVGFQELLLHLHPVFAVLVWPLLGFALLMWLPFWEDAALPPGIWFGGSARGRKLALWTAGGTVLVTFLVVVGDDLLLRSMSNATSNTFVTRGLIPTLLMIGLLMGFYFLLAEKLKYTRAEAVMAGVILVLVALVVCTIIGFWFRGPEMRLTWPFVQNGA